MNHLAHFALTDQKPLTLVGSFLGDYVKGRLNGEFAKSIERGIKLHRAVDAFTDRNAIVRQSYERFDREFRRYAGIMTDVIYDHLLARLWRDYYDSQLEQFSRGTLETLLDHAELLPDRAHQTAIRMLELNAMAKYGTEAFIENSFVHLSGRLSRTNPLDIAFDQYAQHRQGLESDFRDFYPELVAFCDHWQKTR